MIARVLIFIITGIRPVLGPVTCKFPETCTPFAIRQLQEKSLGAAIIIIGKRILSCNPFNRL